MSEATNFKIHGKMSQADYEKLEGLSQSEIAYLDDSPDHFNRRKTFKKESSGFELGTNFHLAVLEPAKFRELYLAEPIAMPNGEAINKRKKGDREFLEQFYQDNLDKVILSEKDMDTVTGMLEAMTRNPKIFELFQGGTSECVATWEYRGIKMKGKADYFTEATPHGRLLVDLKKTRKAKARAFTKSVYNYHYDLQAAHYLMGFGADKFVWLAVEDKAPHGIGIYDSNSWLEKGRLKLDRLLDKYIECQASGVWPSYTNDIEDLIPPSWITAESEDDELYGK